MADFAMVDCLVVAVLLSPLVLIVTFWCWFQWTYRKLIRAASKLPILSPTLPFLGHSYVAIKGMHEVSNHVMGMSMRALAKGIKTFCFWCGPVPIVVVNDIEHIQIVLNSSTTSDKGKEYDYFSFGFTSEYGPYKESILTANGHLWKTLRRHMNPLFNHRNIQQMMPIFNRNSSELVTDLSEHVGNGPVEVMDHTMDISLKSVCHLLFGADAEIDTKSNEFKRLRTVVELIPELFMNRVVHPWLRIESIFKFVYRKVLGEMNTSLKNFSESRLKETKNKAERKMKFLQSTSQDPDSSDQIAEPLNIVDVFNVLRQDYPEYGEADLRTDIFCFYCTGSDTVGSTTASCLLVLAQYQDIQERLYQEVSSVVGPNDDVTLEDLNRMPYMDQVLKETMRRFTVVPYILRNTTTDLNLGGYTIPAETTLMVSLVGIHMDPKTYPDPDKFDPERFSPQNMRAQEKCSFVPFCGGTRTCIAKSYASPLMKVILVHILRKFKLTTKMDIHKIKKKIVITVISEEGYHITFEKRTAM